MITKQTLAGMGVLLLIQLAGASLIDQVVPSAAAANLVDDPDTDKLSDYTFTYKETELVKIHVDAEDPDGEPIAYLFSPPLNESGEWQTSYGDAGMYETTIAASDGITPTKQIVSLIITKKKEAPKIIPLEPGGNSITSPENILLVFRAEAIDPNKDALAWQWILDKKVVSSGNEFSWKADYQSAGDHLIAVKVTDTDGLYDEEFWDVSITDVDQFAFFDDVQDVTAKEGEKVQLALPAVAGLTYEISDPVGNDNLWQTNYNDSGEYTVRLLALGVQEQKEKKLKVTIENVDRPIVWELSLIYIVKEGETLTIPLQATDADGEPVVFSLVNAPADVRIENATLLYNPSFDAANGSAMITATLKATAGETMQEKEIQIKVRNANRPPQIDAFSDVTVKEGESYLLSVRAADPDGNALTYRFEGYQQLQSGITGFQDAGKYPVTVKVSDGAASAEAHAFLTVTDVNQQPVVQNEEAIVSEGDSARIPLLAEDPDGNSLTFSIKEGPSDAVIENNAIVWEVPDEVTENSTQFVVEVSDGEASVDKTIAVAIQKKDLPPRIISVEPRLGSIVPLNKKIVIAVEAEDPEGKKLNYHFDLGRFRSYHGSPKMPIKYPSTGKKEMTIGVSDGLHETTMPYYVIVG